MNTTPQALTAEETVTLLNALACSSELFVIKAVTMLRATIESLTRERDEARKQVGVLAERLNSALDAFEGRTCEDCPVPELRYAINKSASTKAHMERADAPAHSLFVAGYFSDRFQAGERPTYGVSAEPTLRTDTCPARSSDASGMDGEINIVSLPSVGPRPDREKLANWFITRAEFETRGDALAEADALLASKDLWTVPTNTAWVGKP